MNNFNHRWTLIRRCLFVLVFGIWCLAFGIWCLAFGVCPQLPITHYPLPIPQLPNAPIMVNIVEYTDVKLFFIKNERCDRISNICHIGTFFRIFDDLLGFMNILYLCWRKPVF